MKTIRTTASLLALAAAFLASGGCGRPELAEGMPHGIVLVTLDTLRADHLSVYGHHRETSPRIDALAAEGVRFANVISPMPTTDPAHVSLLTGLYPRTHGVLENGVPMVDAAIPSLASWARDTGYRTAAFVSRKHLVPSDLALEGFDQESGPEEKERRGDATLELALAWLEQNADEPYFLWLHLFDPHYPYEAPEPFGARFAPAGHPPPVDRDNKDPRREPYPAEQLALLEALYDGEIAYTDHLVGAFLDALERLHPGDRGEPLLVLTSDHGEIKDEIEERHRFCFDHGKWLYQGALEVPLILHWPGRLPAGVVRDELVELVDLPRSLFDLLGQEGFESQGTSLHPLLEEGAGAAAGARPDYAFTERRRLEREAEVRYRAWQRLAVQDARYKLIRASGGRVVLYDKQSDPEERSDLAESLPEVRARLEAALDNWLDTTPELRSPESGEISEDKLEALRSLGYVD